MTRIDTYWHLVTLTDTYSPIITLRTTFWVLILWTWANDHLLTYYLLKKAKPISARILRALNINFAPLSDSSNLFLTFSPLPVISCWTSCSWNQNKCEYSLKDQIVLKLTIVISISIDEVTVLEYQYYCIPLPTQMNWNCSWEFWLPS